MDSYYLRGNIFNIIYNLWVGASNTLLDTNNSNNSINSINSIYVKPRALENHISTAWLLMDDYQGNDIMTLNELQKRYDIDGDCTIARTKNYRISKICSRLPVKTIVMKSKAMKTFIFNPQNEEDKAKADDLLCKWVVMKKIGILEECEIYEGNESVHCVQKLWDTDIDKLACDLAIKYGYDALDTSSKKIKKNMQLVKSLMKHIVPKIKVIHDKDLVHCDIKPANLMMSWSNINSSNLSNDNELNSSKISIENNSFGIIDVGLCVENYSQWLLSFGTLPYRAPEMDMTQPEQLCEDAILICNKYDIFSLAISLFEIIIGYHPYAHCLDVTSGELNGFVDQDTIDHLIQDHIEPLINDLDGFSSQLLELNIDFDINIELDTMMDEHDTGINEEFVDLLTNMLTASVMERFDINDVMNHSWFKKNCL